VSWCLRGIKIKSRRSGNPENQQKNLLCLLTRNDNLEKVMAIGYMQKDEALTNGALT
jgi:hypothetical protein